MDVEAILLRPALGEGAGGLVGQGGVFDLVELTDGSFVPEFGDKHRFGSLQCRRAGIARSVESIVDQNIVAPHDRVVAHGAVSAWKESLHLPNGERRIR